MISVIIPVFNAENTITNTLKSISKQSIDCKIEIIIINDGSTDTTLEKIHLFQKQNPELNIKLINQVNKGVATARNIGVQHANGKYIAFLDSDDEWLPEKLENQILFLKKYPEYSLCGTNFSGLNVNFNKLKKIADTFYDVSFNDLLVKHYFQPSTVLMKKDIFIEVNGFENGMRYAEEGLLFYNVCFKHKCAIDSNSLIIYGNGKHSFTSHGLASNLFKMELGELHNYKILAKNKKISKVQFIYFIALSLIKFTRRIMIKQYHRLYNND